MAYTIIFRELKEDGTKGDYYERTDKVARDAYNAKRSFSRFLTGDKVALGGGKNASLRSYRGGTDVGNGVIEGLAGLELISCTFYFTD